jgi:hypothetical protein
MTELIFSFVHGVLDRCCNPASEPDPTSKDGALYMASVIGEELFESSKYKRHLEDLLVRFVFPEFQVSSAAVCAERTMKRVCVCVCVWCVCVCGGGGVELSTWCEIGARF